VIHRVSHPEDNQLPQLNENIAEYVRPDRELFQEAQQEVSAFDDAFEIMPNPEAEREREQRKIYWKDIMKREEEKKEEEKEEVRAQEQAARVKLGEKGDGFEFKEDDVKEIGSVNPIEDFKRMIENRQVDLVSEAINQMMGLVERLVLSSMKADLYEKAFDCLKTLREACVKEDEGAVFNKFMEKMKKQFASGEHKGFWEKVKANRVSLITNEESKISSTVTPKEAKDVR